MKKVFIKLTIIMLIACTMWNFLLTSSLAHTAQMQVSDGASSSSLGATSGHSVQEAGETLAAWALNFCNLHAAQCHYDGSPVSYNEPVSDDDLTTQYYFHCVAFISFAIHHALGLGGEEYTEFVKNPYRDSGTSNPNNDPLVNNGFERVDCGSEEWQPGDVIVMWHHVAIYVGDGKTVGMWNEGNNGGLRIRDAQSDCTSNGGYQGWVGRISADSAANAVFEYMVGAGSGGVEGLDGPTTPSGVAVDTAEVDLDELADKFTFDGMPTTVIYEEKKDIFKWLFEGISGFMDYIAGILISVIKAPLLGYVSFFQRIVNAFLHGLN